MASWVKVLLSQARRLASVPWNLREKPGVVCMYDPSTPVESWEVEMGMPSRSPAREPEVCSKCRNKRDACLSGGRQELAPKSCARTHTLAVADAHQCILCLSLLHKIIEKKAYVNCMKWWV